MFWRHATLSPSTVWNELNPSLHASTIIAYSTGLWQVCCICHEPDHSAGHSASDHDATPAVQPLPSLAMGQSASPMRKPVCQETLECIYVSWNCGHCTFPACKYWHIYAACKQRVTGPKTAKWNPPTPPRLAAHGGARQQLSVAVTIMTMAADALPEWPVMCYVLLGIDNEHSAPRTVYRTGQVKAQWWAGC